MPSIFDVLFGEQVKDAALEAASKRFGQGIAAKAFDVRLAELVKQDPKSMEDPLQIIELINYADRVELAGKQACVASYTQKLRDVKDKEISEAESLAEELRKAEARVKDLRKEEVGHPAAGCHVN